MKKKQLLAGSLIVALALAIGVGPVASAAIMDREWYARNFGISPNSGADAHVNFSTQYNRDWYTRNFGANVNANASGNFQTQYNRDWYARNFGIGNTNTNTNTNYNNNYNWGNQNNTNNNSNNGWNSSQRIATPMNVRAVDDISAELPGQPVVGVRWEDRSWDEYGFVVLRSTDRYNWQEIAHVGRNVTNYHDRYVQRGVTYWYKVRAYKGAEGNRISATSAYSNPVTPHYQGQYHYNW